MTFDAETIAILAMAFVYATVMPCVWLDVAGRLVVSERRIRDVLEASHFNTVFIEVGGIFRDLPGAAAWRFLSSDQQRVCQQMKERFREQHYSSYSIAPLIAPCDRADRRALCVHLCITMRSLRNGIDLYKDLNLSRENLDAAAPKVITRLCGSAGVLFETIDGVEKKRRFAAATRVRRSLSESKEIPLPPALAALTESVRSECASWKPQSTEDAYTRKCIDSYVATTVEAYEEAAHSDRQKAESMASAQLDTILNAVVQRKLVTNDDAFARLRANQYFLGERFGTASAASPSANVGQAKSVPSSERSL